MTKMVAMPIYGKNLKNLFLHNQKADDLESCMQHWVLEYVLPSCSNVDPMSNLVPYTFVWGKGKAMDFSETVVVYDIKVGRCS